MKSELYTKNLIIKDITHNHSEDFVKYILRNTRNLEEAIDKINFFNNYNEIESRCYRGIFLKETDRLMGTIGYIENLDSKKQVVMWCFCKRKKIKYK